MRILSLAVAVATLFSAATAQSQVAAYSKNCLNCLLSNSTYYYCAASSTAANANQCYTGNPGSAACTLATQDKAYCGSANITIDAVALSSASNGNTYTGSVKSNSSSVVVIGNLAGSAATITLTNTSSMTYVYIYDGSQNYTYNFNKANNMSVSTSKTIGSLSNVTLYAYNINPNMTGTFMLSYTLGAFATYSASIISMVAGVVFYAATL